MRPGPSITTLASALKIGAHVKVIRGGRVIADPVPVWDLTLEWSSSRAVPGQLTYTAPHTLAPHTPYDPLNNYGQRSIVTVEYEDAYGRTHSTPLGQYVHTGWVIGDQGVKVTAMDLLQLAEDDPLPWPSSPPKGSKLSDELRRLSGLPVTIEKGVTDSAVSPTAQWGNSRTEALWKLATSRSIGLRSSHDGSLHAYPIRDASHLDATYEMSELPGRTGNGLLLTCERAQVGDKRRPNRWIVTGTVKAGDKETKVTATRKNTQAPFDVASYGWVTNHQEFSSADSAKAIEQAAASYMAQDLNALESRSVEIVPDPRLEVGDIIGLVTLDQTVAGRVSAYSLPVTDTSRPMRVDVDIIRY